MLTDSFSRRFTYLRLSITDRCNFRCKYCLPNGYLNDDPHPDLSLLEIEAIVRAFALSGTRKVRITGGEPTLRKDLPEIIRLCKSIPGIEQVVMTTNAYRLNKMLDDYLDAGLDAVNISIDSLVPETFRLITGHDKLDVIMEAIGMAQARGFNAIKMNAVLMREYNGSELQSFLDFVKKTPVTLRFIELMQTGDNQAFFQRHHVSGQSIKERLLSQGWIPVIRSADAGPAQEFSHPDFLGRIGLIMPYSKDFCATCNRLRVSSSAKLHMCLFAEQGISLREYLLEETPEQIAVRIQEMVWDKKATHGLHEGFTGDTRHLAMLGG